MASIPATSQGAPRRRAKRRSYTFPVLAGLAVLAVLGWWGWSRTHPAQNANANLITATVVRGDLVQTIDATGSVNAQTGAEVKIGSQITGTIRRLHADVGSFVHAGDVIAELDLPDIRAQLAQAQANLGQAQTKLLQEQSGVAMVNTQTGSAVDQARAALHSAEAKLASSQAAYTQQAAQTPTDINRAQAALDSARAALSTSLSNQVQTKAGADLQIANAQEQINQADANAHNADLTLQRQQALLTKGYVAQSAVDQAQAQAQVYRSQTAAAQQSLQLTQQKVTADLQSAQDLVTQAHQNVASAQAALKSAQAETFLVKARLADVQDSRAAVRQAQANLNLAQGNTAQDVLKQQSIEQDRQAVAAAKAQVDYASAQVAKTVIRTPITGTVLQLASQQGETLAAGLSAPTLIVVADLTRLQVDAYVDETDIGKVKLGQAADIKVDAFPGKIIHGAVTKIASGSTIQQGVVTYDVTVSLTDKRHPILRPDMTADVTIQVGKRSNVLTVPSAAVKPDKKGATVNILVQKDGKQTFEQRKVKVGGSDGVNTEIRDGVKEGEVVVEAGMPSNNNRSFGPQSPFGPAAGRGGGGGGGGGARGGR